MIIKETASYFYAWTLTKMEIAFPVLMAELQWKLFFPSIANDNRRRLLITNPI